MAVVSKGEKGSWILLNVAFFFQLAQSQRHHLWEAFAKRVWHIDTHLATMPEDLGHPVTAEILPKDTFSLLPGLWCFGSIHPQRRVWLASATLNLCIQGPLLWFAPHTSRLAQYFSFTCFHGCWEDRRGLCGGASPPSQEAQQECFGLRSECLFTQSLSHMAKVTRAILASNCTQKHWRQERTFRCFNHLYIPSPNMCTRHSEILWYETSALCHNLSVLEEICRSNPKYCSTAILTEAKIRQDRRKCELSQPLTPDYPA